MTSKIAVQIAGWMTILVGAFILIAMVTQTYSVLQEGTQSVDCSGALSNACPLSSSAGLRHYPASEIAKFIVLDIYEIFIGVLLLTYGWRIRRMNRRDTLFYIIISFVIGSLAILIAKLSIVVLFIYLLGMIAGLTDWIISKRKEPRPMLIPGSPWPVKILIILCIAIPPLVTEYFFV